MKKKFLRNALLIGENACAKLERSSVALFGIGGVGGFAAEALCRAGIGNLTVFDSDVVEETNLNRQIISNTSVIGKSKTDVLIERLKSINPDIKINANRVFYLPDNAEEFPLDGFDYVIDAIDTVTAKIEIISRAKKVDVPVITCMGTGGKTDISALRVCEIEKTNGCPLARVMRRELKIRGISGVKAVYSAETAVKPLSCGENSGVIPSMIFVPAAAGLMLAREVVFDLISDKK